MAFRLALIALAIMAFFSLIFYRCRGENSVTDSMVEALETQGYQQIQLRESDKSACRTAVHVMQFNARTSRNGKRITGYVCCDWLAACTVVPQKNSNKSR